jgi:hypothetical protein
VPSKYKNKLALVDELLKFGSYWKCFSICPLLPAAESHWGCSAVFAAHNVFFFVHSAFSSVGSCEAAHKVQEALNDKK